MTAKKHPDWNRLFWGRRARPEFRDRIWQIALAVGVSKISYAGSMVSSSETRSVSFLDGRVWITSGWFSAQSGMFVAGDKCLQYVLYKLGFDPGELLAGNAEIYPLNDLEDEIMAGKGNGPK